jgi:hypothetical protein
MTKVHSCDYLVILHFKTNKLNEKVKKITHSNLETNGTDIIEMGMIVMELNGCKIVAKQSYSVGEVERQVSNEYLILTSFEAALQKVAFYPLILV